MKPIAVAHGGRRKRGKPAEDHTDMVQSPRRMGERKQYVTDCRRRTPMVLCRLAPETDQPSGNSKSLSSARASKT
jgi:hypothetical protein